MVVNLKPLCYFLIFLLALSGCTSLKPYRSPVPDEEAAASEMPGEEPLTGSGITQMSETETDAISSSLSVNELLEEGRLLVCTGARQYLDGDTKSALTNFEAALMNLQLADLPQDMQSVGFYQPYLPSECRAIDLTKVYKELGDTVASDLLEGVDLPSPDQLDDITLSQPDRTFIKQEIIRILENLGEESSKDSELETFSQEVEYFIQYFQTQRRDWFERSYYRMLKYLDTVEGIFAEKRLPSELAFLAFVESGYLYRATSRAQARGIWQFIRSTGQTYGLKVGYRTDERLDPVKSTIAAREYLLDLISIFGSKSFLLAMASYNAGEGKVQRCLRAIDDPFEDRSFWKIRHCLRQETQEYIPRIIATAIICENPSRFGFDFPSRSSIMERQDLVICPHQVKLHSVAEVAGISVGSLQELNPDLPSGATWTPVNNMHLWLPKGSGKKVQAALAKMASPPPESTGDYYIVRSGDNLYQIGRRYKIPYKKLAAWNNIAYPYKIKPGQKIYLTPPGTQTTTSTSIAQKTKCDETLVYIVRKGNYLAGIGYIFGTSAREIMALNGLTRGTIFPGQRLLICPGHSMEIIQHEVTSGETLIKIAKDYNVDIEDILFVNGMDENDILNTGQKLTVYRKTKRTS